MSTKPRHTVRLTVEVQFEGTYYEPREMVNLCDGWFSSALDDRSDVSGYSLTGTVTAEQAGTSAPRRFYLHRDGIRYGEGLAFTDGTCIMRRITGEGFIGYVDVDALIDDLDSAERIAWIDPDPADA